MSKKDLESAIERVRKEQEKLEEKERLEEMKLQQRIKEYNQYEGQKRGQKFKLYSEIRNWADEFVETDNFKKLIDLENAVEIFGDVWGHKPDGDSYGCWSYVIINESGKLIYEAGYKWMGVSESFLIDENSTQRLNFRYLRDLSESLKTGEVYNYIKRRVDNVADNPLMLTFKTKRKER